MFGVDVVVDELVELVVPSPFLAELPAVVVDEADGGRASAPATTTAAAVAPAARPPVTSRTLCRPCCRFDATEGS